MHSPEHAAWRTLGAAALVLAGCVRAQLIDCVATPDHPTCIADLDAGSDVGAPDAGTLDAGDPDTGGADAGMDAGVADAGMDAGVADAGGADASAPDAGVPDATGADAGGAWCTGTVTCDRFDDGDLTTGLFVAGAAAPTWTIRHIDDTSWHETIARGGTVLASGPGASSSWWGSACVPPTGPAIIQASSFAVGSAPGYAIDFDYYHSTSGCGNSLIGVGLADTEPALSWSPSGAHFIGDTWFFALAGVGIELYDPNAAMIFNSGPVGYPPAGFWNHYHVEVCTDGRRRLTLTDVDTGAVLVTHARTTPDARVALSGAIRNLGVFLFAEGPNKYFDDLRVTPGCSL